MLVTVVATVVMAAAVQQTEAVRILMAVPISARSHNNFFMAIAEQLAQRNHTVTYVTGYELSHKSPNIEMVVVPGVQILEKMHNSFTYNPTGGLNFIMNDLKTICLDALAYEGVQRLKDKVFDLVMMYTFATECFLTFVHTLKVPFIYMYPNKMSAMFAHVAGSPSYPSMAINMLLDLPQPLTFTGRMMNTIYDLYWLGRIEWIIIPSQDRECRARHLCPEDMPALRDFRLNNSLFIANSVRTMENPTLPYAPTVVHAGGIHCRPAEPLPEDLEEWVTGAGKPGIILFSLGSLVKPSTMPETYKKVLLGVFGSLQQRVLLKWDEDTMEGLPPNVRLARWLPQQDILGHPQLRLFITHGGLFSIFEATYHGVPILGLPVTLDQHRNMRVVEQETWGRVLDWEDLIYDSLRGHILQILNDPMFREEARRRGRIMRDQPVSPGDYVTYWVEYVLRHQGARHLRSPAMDIPWYQLYNVDVWAVVVVVTVVAVGLASWLSYRAIRTLVGCCCRSMKTKKD